MTAKQTTTNEQAKEQVFEESNEAPSLRKHLGREVQQFGTMRNRPIGLAEDVRNTNSQNLNQTLADTVILYNLYKKSHWLLTGHTFYQLHLLFDKHAEEQEVLVDALAERIQILGGIAVSDPRHVAEITQIERPPNGAEDVPAILTRLMDAHEIILKNAREFISVAEDNEDGGTADLLQSQVLRTNEMQAWFISEHTVDLAPNHV